MKHEYEDAQHDEKPEGRYANYFKVGHNAFEFVLDFGQGYNDDEENVQFHTRIVTTPAYVKRLSETLWKSIKQFEHTFGTIQE